jgi:hypothetical protein
MSGSFLPPPDRDLTSQNPRGFCLCAWWRTFVHEPRKLPVVLSPEEGARLLDAAPGAQVQGRAERGLWRESARRAFPQLAGRFDRVDTGFLPPG